MATAHPPGRRILIVDDDEQSRISLQRLLRSEGYDALTAPDGVRALESISESPPDVVLTDLRMPGMHGTELCRRIRAADEDLPIIVTTALGAVEDAIESLRAGATDYMVKPLDFETLLFRIQRALELHAARIEREHLRQHTQELYEASKAALESYEHVLAVVGHDLRNPLGVIAFHAQALGARAADEQTRQIGETLTRSVARMKLLLDNLLEEARLRSSRPTIHPDQCELAELLADIRELRPLALVRHVELQVAGPKTPVWVSCDRAGINQVIANLVSNAIRFSPAGERVAVTARADERGVQLEVSDHGRGIAPDAIERIFERFWQGQKDGHAGLGLGLFIAKEIVTAHQGTIEVDSALGEGTTFRVSLPIVTQHMSRATA